MFGAAQAGSLSVAQSLINANANLDTLDNQQFSAIDTAFSSGSTTVAALLLNSGASTDGLEWNSLFMSAARGNLIELSNLLWSNRYLIDQTDALGNTALHIAAMMSQAGAVKRLHAQHADLSIENHEGHTALHVAAMFGNAECVFRLLDAGAEIDEPGGSPKMLPDGALLSHYGLGMERLTPLTLAVQRNPDIEVAKVLITAGADLHPNVPYSPLWVALGCTAPWSFQNSPDIEQVKLLIKSGADVHQRCLRVNTKVTMLMHAVESGSAECVSELLNSGANVHDRDGIGNTALHYVKHGDDETIVRLLVDAGADVNAANLMGITPLMKSAEAPNALVMALLLEFGADPHVVTESGSTALGQSHKHPKQIQLLLDKGVDPNVPDNHGDSPILLVTMFGSYWAAQQLVQAGCDVNVRNRKGETPLIVAIEKWDVYKAQLFLEHGADSSCRNDAGESVFDIAEKIKSEKRKAKTLDLLSRYR